MASSLTIHWTERNADACVQRTASDFMLQVQKVIDANGAKQTDLASVLGVTPGRVSQVLNTPGNLTLKKVVQYARAIGRKVSIVLYDDGDPQNHNGPIDGQIFVTCWENAGRPTTYRDWEVECRAGKRGATREGRTPHDRDRSRI